MKTKQNIVLITGGTSGIGLALAKKFVDEGNKVIITGRSQEKIDYVKGMYPNIVVERADITNENDLKLLVEKYTDINILVNNAGIHYEYDLLNDKVESDLIKLEIDTNLIGPMILTKYILPLLITKESAAIINVTSYFGIVPKPIAPGYCASKAGARSFTKALRGQLINTKIKVFELVPPICDTPMTESINKKGVKKMSTDELVNIYWKGFRNNKYEIYPGLSKIVYLLSRLCPKFTEKMIWQITMK